MNRISVRDVAALLPVNTVRLFSLLADRFGDRIALRLGNRDFYLINDPSVIGDVLVGQGTRFRKFPHVDADVGVFGDGLLTSEEPDHTAQRKLMQPAFHNRRIDAYESAIAGVCQEHISAWRDGQQIDAGEELNRLTLEVICRTMFGASSREHARAVSHQLERVLPRLNDLVMPLGRLKLRLPLRSTREYHHARSELDTLLASIVRERRNTAGSDDLVGMLLAQQMSDRELRDQLMTIFIAGHETVANGLTWALYLLARHPRYWQWLGSPERRMAVVNESLRLYPPVWILGREPLEDLIIGGLPVRRRDVVLVCMYALHRRPAVFDNPDDFRPERWLQDPPPPRFAYLPFGAGRRICIGERFAIMEMNIILEAIASRFCIAPVSEQEIDPSAMLTLRPRTPVRLKLCC